MSAVSGGSPISTQVMATLSRMRAEGTPSEEAKESQLVRTREQMRAAASPATMDLGKLVDRFA